MAGENWGRSQPRQTMALAALCGAGPGLSVGAAGWRPAVGGDQNRFLQPRGAVPVPLAGRATSPGLCPPPPDPHAPMLHPHVLHPNTPVQAGVTHPSCAVP